LYSLVMGSSFIFKANSITFSHLSIRLLPSSWMTLGPHRSFRIYFYLRSLTQSYSQSPFAQGKGLRYGDPFGKSKFCLSHLLTTTSYGRARTHLFHLILEPSLNLGGTSSPRNSTKTILVFSGLKTSGWLFIS
jgi:hypothetical protein